MSYQRGPDRSQVQLLPPCLDDYVAPNAPARFIDAYVEGLDFQGLGFTHAQPAATGRPAYHPADLLKLYLYGYLNRIRSSRRLEAEAGRNLELMWLLRGLRPDFKTIADFRKDNRSAFKPLFQDFHLLCRKLNLFGAELVAIDGSKFKAANNLRRHYTQEQLRELVQKVEARIDEYLGELDQQDIEAEGVPAAPSRTALEEKIALLQTRKGKAQQLEACAAAGITTFVPARGTTSGKGRDDQAIHPKEAFTYDGVSDTYRCPAGRTLARGYAGEHRGKQCVYYYNVAACGSCGQRAACTTGAYRKLSRLVNEAVVERQAERVQAHPELVRRRKEIVEHVFGTLRNWGHDRFLLKGLEKVRAEFSLSCLTYNLRRVLNLVKMDALLAAVAAGALPTGASGV